MAHKTSGAKTRWGWNTVSLVAMALALGAGGSAYAQDQEEEEIVVTGFRGSLAQAVDIKREEVAAVDAIVAEDIADFPDQNLSESIQRIPGVAITRGGGEGRQIAVRGLGAQFTRVRINGMEALSTVGATDAEGGANRNRNFDFNVFASELFNEIRVRKSAEAETEEGSLGATVELQTAQPFDYRGFTLAITGQAGRNDLSEQTDPRAAFVVSNRWGDFGALFSVAYSSRDGVEEGASTVRWRNNTGCPGTGCFQSVVGNAAAVNAAFHPRIPRYDYYETTQERLGVTGAFQWRPGDNTDISLNLLHSTLDATRMESFLQAPVFSTNGANGIGAVDVLAYEIRGNSLVYGLFNDVDIRSETRFDVLSTEFNQVTLDIEHDFTDRLRGSVMVGQSESDHQNPIQTTLLWDAQNVQGYSYDFRNNPNVPSISYGATNVASPATWTLSQIRLRPITVMNTFETVKGDLEFDISPSLTLSGGANMNTYEYETTELRRWNGSTSANIEATIPGFAAGTPLANYLRLTSLSGNSLNFGAGATTLWAAPDVRRAGQLWDLYNTAVFPMSIEPVVGGNASITEDTQGAWVQLDWDMDIGNIPVRGNIGLRAVETELTSVGYTYDPGTSNALRQSVDHSYSDTLPSLNIVAEPIEDFLIRFGASQVMSRPGLGNLNPGAVVAGSATVKTVTAGNPRLDPFRADAYDLSFEWYFADEALFSVALFYKDVNSFVQTLRSVGTFTGNPLGIPDSVAIAACGGQCSPSDTDWQFVQPINTPGGTVEGFEVSLQLPFFFLPGALSDFGFIGNYTNVDSSFDTYGNGPAPTFPLIVVSPGAQLVNLSPESWNATVYYENDTFSARVSGAYRSSYITQIPGRDANASESTDATFNVDAAATWNVNDHLTFTWEGLNLTDEVSNQYLSPDDRMSFYHAYGRSMFVGFRYKY